MSMKSTLKNSEKNFEETKLYIVNLFTSFVHVCFLKFAEFNLQKANVHSGAGANQEE